MVFVMNDDVKTQSEISTVLGICKGRALCWINDMEIYSFTDMVIIFTWIKIQI